MKELLLKRFSTILQLLREKQGFKEGYSQRLKEQVLYGNFMIVLNDNSVVLF